ncbi:squalene/phytoene synthase family protein [Granulosicoccus sp. 3-233]|uniref:squalene/phytoene synthase family protein n=1 Tax=Granulosicoccus sp. 3-233 TaxID=3417969 RepID=UPI003D33037F
MLTIREGSSLYYSLLWTTPAARQRFIERLHLIQSLSTTLEDVQEPQVAERKIHWWHEELQRLMEGTARHPATQATHDSMAEQQQAMACCLAILGAASTLRFTPPASDAEVDTLLEQDYSARLALLAHALSDNDAELDPQRHSQRLARALGKHERLSRLPVMLHRGQPVFSTEMYQRFGIRPTDLASHIRKSETQTSDADDVTAEPASTLDAIAVVVDKPARQSLLNAAIADAHHDFAQALKEPSSRQHYRQRSLLPLWRLSILRERQLALWTRRPPDLLRERSTLTPVHKLFWAWRHRR